ncbi:MAG TPA: beta-ketoacyl-ACP synthase III [Sandaracinaceae bacterium LLY-WYZ-13_1]|nr:beta-ketoacyl-ACP synthase III [Sandaracinaceae bacterium LLY-WYZ-13_1]
MTHRTALTGSGTFLPPHSVTNDELCGTFNTWVRRENERRRADIEAGRFEELRESSPAFVEKVSGIRARRYHDASGILDPERMCPRIPDRDDAALSVQAEMAKHAALEALASAELSGEDVDLIIVGASSLQRPYPAIAIELQESLRARGVAFDISVGCSSGTFAIQLASQALETGAARRALVCVPELPSAYSNFRDRDSHFILGDAAAAVVVQTVEEAGEGAWEIVSSASLSRFSSNVRNNGGFLNRGDEAHRLDPDKLFYQDGRKVFRDIVRLVPRFVRDQLTAAGLTAGDLARCWLHQANGRMNEAIATRLLGEDVDAERVPSVLHELGNTAAAGALVAFDRHREGLAPGSTGILCAFGAGYTIGSQLLRRI